MYADWGYWQLYHSVTFNGETKVITVNPDVNSINIKTELYSDWKEWFSLRDNAKYLPALRTTGGDPIGSGAYTGDVYFLINGWQILIDHSCTIDGVIYSDDYASPFIQVENTQIVTNKVSSLVSVIAPIVDAGDLSIPTTSDIWNYTNRSLTTQIPTAAEIRAEIDTNSIKLQQIISEHVTILDSINNVSVSSSVVNSPAVSFTLISGIVTSGTYLDTKSINGSAHVIVDQALAFNIYYTFDIGLDAIPSSINFAGRVADKHEIIQVAAWNYLTSAWENIGNIPGSTTAINETFILYQSFVGNVAGQLGDVKIRFYSDALSDIILTVDQLYVSYAIVERPSGYSGHIVTATPSSLQLGSDAVSINNYYVPAIVYVNHGTGAMQYAKVTSYIGSTKTLQLSSPMAVVLDSSSHITLSPWGDQDNAAIASAVWGHPLKELTTSMTPTDLWNFLLSTPTLPGSAGDKLKQVLTTSNFLALK